MHTEGLTTKYDQICDEIPLLLPRTFVDISTKAPIIVRGTNIVAISMEHNLSWQLPRTYTVQKMGKKNPRTFVDISTETTSHNIPNLPISWIYPPNLRGYSVDI